MLQLLVAGGALHSWWPRAAEFGSPTPWRTRGGTGPFYSWDTHDTHGFQIEVGVMMLAPSCRGAPWDCSSGRSEGRGRQPAGAAHCNRSPAPAQELLGWFV